MEVNFDYTVSMMKKYIKLVIALIFVTTMCVLLFSKFSSSNAIKITDEKEHALELTEKLIEFVIKYRDKPMPTNDSNFPSFLWVNDDCWNLLQKSISEREYELDVISEYNSSDNIEFSNNRSEIWIRISISNSQSIQVLYAQGGLTYCSTKK